MIRIAHVSTAMLIVVALLSSCVRNDIRSHTIALPAMTDPESAAEISELLDRTHGVLNFTLDLDNQVANVSFDSRVVAEKNLEMALARAGYRANSVHALPIVRD